MTFQSSQFFLFFPVVVLLYFGLPVRFRNGILLIASATFYMAWRPEYILLIVFSVTVDYFVALGIVRAPERGRRWLLGASLVSNLGLLFFYKYVAFAAEAYRAAMGLLTIRPDFPALEILLPVGISFYTFQALSYTIDVYRGTILPERNYFRLCLYVLFFPQLVAGPIERSSNLLPQFREVHAFDYDSAVSGLRLALWGLVKKVAIADRLAFVADKVYAEPQAHGGPVLVAGTIAFAFQIYADFSAYSDIAVGTARVLGFRLMTNFDRPYFAVSPIDFWRRWHISLSTWFRDYVYIPLGGNRGGLGRWMVAALTTFLLSGVWHGAGWTFLVWGAYHGLLVVGTRLAGRLTTRRPPAAVSGLITFVLVLVGWVFFRSKSLDIAGYILTHLFDGSQSLKSFLDYRFDWCVAGLGVSALILAEVRVPAREKPWPGPLRWAAYATAILLLLNARMAVDVPFIYFQF